SRAERSTMQFPFVGNEQEPFGELGVKLGRTVAHDRQAAALERTVLGKGRDYEVPAGLHRAHGGIDVGAAVFSGRQKMEDGAIVPQIIRAKRNLSRGYVGFQPDDGIGSSTEPGLRRVKRSAGNIQ